MAGSMTEIPVNGDAVPAYISLPPSGSGPGVVVIQEWWGLVPHIRDVADRLAAQGFVAVAPDLYRGKETTEPDEAGKLVMEMQLEQAAKDMAAAVDALLAMPETTGQGAGVVGFCVGGGLALFLASRKPEVRAVVGTCRRSGGRCSATPPSTTTSRPRRSPSASSASCAPPGWTSPSTTTRAPATPSSTTAGPRSTTPRRPTCPGSGRWSSCASISVRLPEWAAGPGVC
jgi:pimeloyl-ACP methyl ester carboxylesterase